MTSAKDASLLPQAGVKAQLQRQNRHLPHRRTSPQMGTIKHVRRAPMINVTQDIQPLTGGETLSAKPASINPSQT